MDLLWQSLLLLDGGGTSPVAKQCGSALSSLIDQHPRLGMLRLDVHADVVCGQRLAAGWAYRADNTMIERIPQALLAALGGSDG